jgi:hypothetical protein
MTGQIVSAPSFVNQPSAIPVICCQFYAISLKAIVCRETRLAWYYDIFL